MKAEKQLEERVIVTKRKHTIEVGLPKMTLIFLGEKLVGFTDYLNIADSRSTTYLSAKYPKYKAIADGWLGDWRLPHEEFLTKMNSLFTQLGMGYEDNLL